MSALDDFLAERRAWPWRLDGPPDGEGAPARQLYDAYKAAMNAQDRPVLPPRDFGLAVVAAGFERRRVPSGHVYPRLTVETRAERARSEMDFDIWNTAYGDVCTSMEGASPDLIAAACRARVEAAHRDGTFEQWLEHIYGPYLRWQPGEPHPGKEILRREAERKATRLADKRAEIEAQIAAIDAQIAAAQEIDRRALEVHRVQIDALVNTDAYRSEFELHGRHADALEAANGGTYPRWPEQPEALAGLLGTRKRLEDRLQHLDRDW